jgi:tetratricopeptide (TPR) repeat protein
MNCAHPRHLSIPPAVKIIVLILFWAGGIFLILAVRGDIPSANKTLRKIPWLRSMVVQRDQVAANAQVQTLNYFIPTFEYLCEFIKDPGKFDQNRLRGWDGYLDYYEKVTATFPDLAEGYALAGFFYFYAGDVQRAVESYEKACFLNPYVFWPHYNLGILEMRLGRYSQAAASFTQALRTNPKVNLKFIFTSKLYQQILLTTNFNYNPAQSLQQGYQDAAAFGQLSQRLMQNPKVEFKTRLDLKIF